MKTLSKWKPKVLKPDSLDNNKYNDTFTTEATAKIVEQCSIGKLDCKESIPWYYNIVITAWLTSGDGIAYLGQ